MFRYGVTQGTTQAVEYGCLQQEIAHALGLAFENFPGKIIEHKAVTAGKSLDKTAGVGAPLHGQCGQLQPGDPTLGAGFERGDVRVFQVQPHHAVKKVGGLGGGEAQVGGAQFGQLAAHAQAG